MTGAAWRITWRLALRRRRLLLWNLLVPAILLVPVVLSAAAAAHQAVVVAVFVAFFGAYGSCIPLIRDGMSGWVEKVVLTGYGTRKWLFERIAASVALDVLELLPVTALLLVLVDAPPLAWITVPAATGTALLFANLLGIVVAAAVGALGEAALGCAVISLFALHGAGVFRTPAPGSGWAHVEAWSPFRWVHEAWLAVLSGAPGVLRLSIADLGGYLARPLATIVVLGVLVAVGAPVMARRLAV